MSNYDAPFVFVRKYENLNVTSALAGWRHVSLVADRGRFGMLLYSFLSDLNLRLMKHPYVSCL